MAPALPAFDTLLARPLVLLLDGLNEMPHASREDYNDRLAVWQTFLDRLVREHPNARVIFTCRTLDYGEKLTTAELPRVPQVEIAPLAPPQVKEFLAIYSPGHGLALWEQLDGTPQLGLYSSPFYLNLLIEQTGTDGKILACIATIHIALMMGAKTLRIRIARGCCVAGRGAAIATTAVAPTATGTILAAATSVSGFGFVVRPPSLEAPIAAPLVTEFTVAPGL
jgi:hypothetical protein